MGLHRSCDIGACDSIASDLSADQHGTAEVILRDYQDSDWPEVLAIYEKSGLPIDCLADATDPLFLIRRVLVNADNKISMAAFVRLTSEPFLIVDHESGKPAQRWEMLQELTRDICRIAREKGLQQLTAFIPPDVEVSFGKRLERLGFQKSPWSSYTLNL